jgi:hypothetical protein
MRTAAGRLTVGAGESGSGGRAESVTGIVADCRAAWAVLGPTVAGITLTPNAAFEGSGEPRLLLPLDGGGRLRGHVVDDAIDLRHLVGNTCGDAGKQVVRQARPVGSHVVVGRNRT